VATFPTNLTLNRTSTGDTIQVSGGGLVATTGPINVTPAPGTQLVVTTPPPGIVTSRSGFGLVVTAEDGAGNVDPTYNGPVALALASNPGGTSLGGTPSVAAVGGVATFSALSLNNAAAGYTLQVTGGGLSGATTSPIAVIAAPATQLVITTQPP